MQETLQLLIELQEIERKIKILAEDKARAPKEIAALEEKKREAEARLEDKKIILESTKKLRRDLEREVEDLEGRKAKSKQKLLEVKSNKEYQATLKEIEDIGELVRGREDQIIEQMESADDLDNQIREQKLLVAEAVKKLEEEGAQLEKEAKEADSLMMNLEEHKEQLKPKIPSDLLKKYQFLRDNRGGVALAPVNRGTCGVCHMNLPPQTFIDLQRNEAMMNCPNCQRIIYWTGHEAYKQSSQLE
ncbi:MAG: C4-type zinc ribbon domain-containing protein [Syntrophobacterales bacterium]